MRVLAGAGTGKTRAITHRIAYGVATGAFAPTEVLAVTFTTRAAGELRGRLRRLGAVGVQARTFHSAALRQARYFWPQVYGSELPSLIASKLGLLGEAVGRQPAQGAGRPARPGRRDRVGEGLQRPPRRLRPARAASRPRGRGLRRRDGGGGLCGVRRGQALPPAHRHGGRPALRAAVLSDDERVAATVRRQYQWFVVDEFQDVSPIQSALLDLWLGGRDDLCVVGDPAQTIYSFAGARPTTCSSSRRSSAAPRRSL